jgi:hypothetical protein
MTEPIIPIDRIKQQAREAAARYENVNDACPYSFYTDAGRVFKSEFGKTRLEQSIAKNAPAKGARPS